MINRYSYLLYLLFVGLIALTMFRVPSIDPFHTGEYFVQLINLEHGLNTFTIHGAVNYVPAFISKFLFDDKYILATSILIKFLAILSSFLFTYICYLLLDKNTSKYVYSIFIFSISLSFITHRDFFLMLSIIFFVKTIISISSSSKLNNLQMIFFGLVMAASIFWTFDRGIAGLVSIGVAYIYIIVKNKNKNKILFLPLVSFFLSVILLNVFFESTSIIHWFNNVSMLIKSSSQWHYPFSLKNLALTSFAYFCFFFTIFNVIKHFRANKDYSNRAFLLFVFTLSVILLKSAVNRVDVSHVLLTLIGFSFAVTYIIGLDLKINYTSISLKLDFFVLILISFFLVFLGFWFRELSFLYLLVMFLFIFINQNYFKNIMLFKYIALTSLVIFIILFSMKAYKNNERRPIEQATTEGIDWVVKVLSSNNVRCIFDYTNNGIINAKSNLPTCTKYAYPIYTPYEKEKEILFQLKENDPNLVVYSGNFLYSVIDAKPMSYRYPKVDAYIKNNYRFEKCKFGYCIKSKFNFF